MSIPSSQSKRVQLESQYIASASIPGMQRYWTQSRNVHGDAPIALPVPQPVRPPPRLTRLHYRKYASNYAEDDESADSGNDDDDNVDSDSGGENVDERGDPVELGADIFYIIARQLLDAGDAQAVSSWCNMNMATRALCRQARSNWERDYPHLQLLYGDNRSRRAVPESAILHSSGPAPPSPRSPLYQKCIFTDSASMPAAPDAPERSLLQTALAMRQHAQAQFCALYALYVKTMMRQFSIMLEKQKGRHELAMIETQPLFIKKSALIGDIGAYESAPLFYLPYVPPLNWATSEVQAASCPTLHAESSRGYGALVPYVRTYAQPHSQQQQWQPPQQQRPGRGHRLLRSTSSAMRRILARRPDQNGAAAAAAAAAPTIARRSGAGASIQRDGDGNGGAHLSGFEEEQERSHAFAPTAPMSNLQPDIIDLLVPPTSTDLEQLENWARSLSTATAYRRTLFTDGLPIALVALDNDDLYCAHGRRNSCDRDTMYPLLSLDDSPAFVVGDVGEIKGISDDLHALSADDPRVKTHARQLLKVIATDPARASFRRIVRSNVNRSLSNALKRAIKERDPRNVLPSPQGKSHSRLLPPQMAQVSYHTQTMIESMARSCGPLIDIYATYPGTTTYLAIVPVRGTDSFVYKVIIALNVGTLPAATQAL